MNKKWIQGIIGMLGISSILEILHMGNLEEERATKKLSNNSHSEEFLPLYPREVIFEEKAEERPSALFPFRKRSTWPYHWSSERYMFGQRRRSLLIKS